MTNIITRTFGIGLLTVAAVGLNNSFSEHNRLREQYLIRQPTINEEVREKAKNYAIEITGSYSDYLGERTSLAALILGGAYIALGSQKKKEN